MASVIIYSVFTAACGFATTALQLAVFRILLGIGMGGVQAVPRSCPRRGRPSIVARRSD